MKKSNKPLITTVPHANSINLLPNDILQLIFVLGELYKDPKYRRVSKLFLEVYRKAILQFISIQIQALDFNPSNITSRDFALTNRFYVIPFISKFSPNSEQPITLSLSYFDLPLYYSLFNKNILGDHNLVLHGNSSTPTTKPVMTRKNSLLDNFKFKTNSTTINLKSLIEKKGKQLLASKIITISLIDTNIKEIDQNELLEVAIFFMKLNKLRTLYLYDIVKKDLDKLINTMTKNSIFEEFVISYTTIKSQQLTSIITALAPSKARLKKLCLSGFMTDQPNDIILLSKLITDDLQEFSLAKSQFSTKSPNLCFMQLTEVICSHRNLKTLDISGGNFLLDDTILTNKSPIPIKSSLFQILSTNKSIEILKMQNIDFSDLKIQELITALEKRVESNKANKLHTIEINFGEECTAATLESFVDICKNLNINIICEEQKQDYLNQLYKKSKSSSGICH